MTEKTTTITIRKDTMRELKRRAVEADKTYTDYLEELIQHVWKSKIESKPGDTSDDSRP